MVRVVVIGAGASGLTSIKACKEGNVDVVCYEWSSSVGGLWKYKEKPVEGMGSVDKTTIINTSKEYLAYSDFPFPKEYANFMRHTQVVKYLESYAEKFRLLSSIKFNHKVIEVTPADDYQDTGRWKILVKDEKQNLLVEDVTDAVMVCTGHHGYPLKPRFAGDEKFRGSITHNHSYKDSWYYQGKRVLIIGLGNTGGDVAVDVCRLAEKTYISTSKGSWIFKRMEKYGVPYDTTVINRITYTLSQIIPFSWLCSILERGMNEWFDHKKYQLAPKHRVLEAQLTVNDELPNKLLSGEITVKGSIVRFEENGVVFEGDDEMTEVDDVILATGYETKFPFLSDDILKIKENDVRLYKYVYPPHLKHSTFGMIGLLDGLGGSFPLFEIQARWFVQVLQGRVSLPSESEMKKDIHQRTEQLQKRFYKSARHNVIADYIGYLDEISTLIGVRPNFWKILIMDPVLWLTLIRGPSTACQYRLNGIHSWPLARETILNSESRIWEPLKTRFKENDDVRFEYWKILAIILTLATVIVAFFVV